METTNTIKLKPIPDYQKPICDTPFWQEHKKFIQDMHNYRRTGAMFLIMAVTATDVLFSDTRDTLPEAQQLAVELMCDEIEYNDIHVFDANDMHEIEFDAEEFMILNEPANSLQG